MAKPKLALIPAAQGDKFYSVLPSDGVGDFDFTRASTGTRIAPTGLIEEVASGDSRLNYDLLNGKVVNYPHYLLEPARTNFLPYSEDFSQWTLDGNGVGQSITSNYSISPEGVLNATRLQLNKTGGSFSRIRKAVTATYSGTGIFSVYLKTNDGSTKTISMRWSGSGSIEKTINGDWQRFDVSGTAINTLASDCEIFVEGNQNNIVDLSVYGAMQEAGSYPTSYIPTNGTTITRAAESADDSGDAATFNDSEGVLMAEISALANDGTYRQISINDSSTNNRITLDFTNTDNQIRSFISFNGTSQALMVGSTIATNQSKAAVSYKSNDFSLWLNGFKVDTDTNGSVPTGLNNLNFDNGGGANDFYGKTREVQYFDSALTDAQLETLTSWTSLQEMITSQLYTNY